MKAIQTLGLSKRYHGRVACNSISLSVDQGAIFGLLGPNGAGKSTLVKMLVGLVNPSAGSARVLGFSFRELEPRRHLGYLPELFRYQPWLTAEEVLIYHAGLLQKPLSSEARDALLARVGLEGRGRERVKSFSKGMQQRLGLAAALVGDPALIFLDEPTSALDPIGRYEVSRLLRELKAEGRTIFLNSHLLSDVEKVCDGVALIDAGQVLYQGSLDDAIYGGVRQYRVQIGSAAPGVLEALKEDWPSLVVQWGPRGSGDVRVHLLREELPKLTEALVSRGVAVYEVEPDHSSLEEWFLNRLGRKDAD